MKAVIFDLDGTIVFSHPTHFAAYERLFKEFGITWSYNEFNNLFAGTGAPRIIELILTRNGIKNFNLEQLVKRKRDYFNEILKNKKLEVVRGFFEFLKTINAARLQKAIASGSNRQNILSMLENIGAKLEFRAIVSGEEVENPKPAPDIFLAAAKLINVQPSECLVLEDTDHGVIAAKKAGMKCIAFTTTLDENRLKKAGADEVVADYTKIRL